MAHYLRGKQAGIQSDFSASVGSDLFVLDDLHRIGISSQISHVAYDPVQAILAVGTNSTKFGPGQIYVFGQKRVAATLELPRQGASVRALQFASDRLICLDSKNDLCIFSLIEKKMLFSYSPPAPANVIASDPTLDYVVIGLQTGEIIVYDMDRGNLAPFRITNLWTEQNPRARYSPVVSLQFHPRDIGKLLIGYAEGAVVYSFKKDEPRKFFQYFVPRGAPGGDSDPSAINRDRAPKLTQAVWHPTGTFILSGHEDSSMVIWDPKEGKIIMARTLTETYVNNVGANASFADKGSFAPKAPLVKISWCAKQDPDDTGILVAGGFSAMHPINGLTFMELGRTPVYATSPWQILSDHFDTPKKHTVIQTPPKAEVVDFCLIPRKSPWFAGGQDPIAVICVLSSGEIATMSFPSGYAISPTNQLHVSLTLVHPFVGSVSQTTVERDKWLGMTENRSSGPPILRGGTEATRPMKRYESRDVIQTGHADGTVRLWDIGHGDEIENDAVCQADVARAVGRQEDVHVTKVSFSGASCELAAGLKSGEVVVFRWMRNNRAGEPPPPGPNEPGVLMSITERKDPALTEGLHPFTLLSQQSGPCTALKVSDVGFIASGFENGDLVIIDMRGPAVIYKDNIHGSAQKEKSGPFKRKNSNAAVTEWVTNVEYSVMTVEHDDYSSILLHAGTSRGRVLTLKILPSEGGRYAASFVGAVSMEDRVILIHPLNNASGQPAYASQTAVGRLRSGYKVDGSLLVVTRTEARIFKPATSRGASRDWGSAFCDAAAVTHCHDLGIALVCLFGDGTARSYSIPGLKEIGNIRLDGIMDVKMFPEAAITASGEVLGYKGPSELAVVQVWGTGQNLIFLAYADSSLHTADKIFDPKLLIPPRPTISNFQWVSGTQFITPSDMDILISGPDRPPSKRMIEQARADEAARRTEARAGGASSAAEGSQEGWAAYMQRQIQERTENLGLAGDRMDHLESNSAGWTEDVNKFVSRQKKNLVMGAVKRQFGF